ncbi:supressor protein SugE [[Bacillus] enclensis]|jgi:multidrug transporter EmrE-like cation transporter|uniref:Quaternary ammonium compound-resistance protein SugE n=1 Tax=[Bacillus] enclensis TaxID=1402860 RepID=A0A0V8HLI0_9BACI|nr:multidrug efflux SMR transporter [[Bacillus] enclensis]KSU63282.1 supressor protein SugE [[Bacillus] enclensis]OAT83842.1 supressor protein SugE [Bacillus sp. MKU004]QWC21311.1 multidrug efflux SMR transporter [Bacillus haikouensis]SCB81296.1 quaternary ammonium compound-resistance protein SugE [[Bacillus] enclensis]
MAWMILIAAGLCEVIMVTFMKLSDGYKKFVPSILSFSAGALSFYLLSLSLLHIPVSTGYGIWTGIGSAGAVLIGMLFFKEEKNPSRLFFIGLIIFSIIGLKTVS